MSKNTKPIGITEQALQQQPLMLPLHGFSRTPQLMPFLPFGRTKLNKLIKEGKFPAPVRFGDTHIAFSNEAVHQWFKELQASNDNQYCYNEGA